MLIAPIAMLSCCPAPPLQKEVYTEQLEAAKAEEAAAKEADDLQAAAQALVVAKEALQRGSGSQEAVDAAQAVFDKEKMEAEEAAEVAEQEAREAAEAFQAAASAGRERVRHVASWCKVRGRAKC